jgi:hypothetical protein
MLHLLDSKEEGVAQVPDPPFFLHDRSNELVQILHMAIVLFKIQGY